MFAYHSSLKIVFQLTSFPHNGDVRVSLHDCVNGQKLFMSLRTAETCTGRLRSVKSPGDFFSPEKEIRPLLGLLEMDSGCCLLHVRFPLHRD